MQKKHCGEWEDFSNEYRPKVRYWVPAAAMDQADLEEELWRLKERGFGGVEVVTLSMLPEEILMGEDRWGTDHWNEMVQVIAEETEKLGMSMDLANGPMWPISMPTIQSADDSGALYELTYGIIECPSNGHYEGALPEARTKRDEGTVKLISLMAYLEIGDKTLVRDSCRDLMGSLKRDDGCLTVSCDLSAAEGGTRWLIFAFYSQPAVHKTGKGQYYVIDHLSEDGVRVCESYWDALFEKAGAYPSMESLFCDSLEYQVMMDWTSKMAEEFEKRRGYSVLPFLPVVGLKVLYPESDVPEFHFENQAVSDMINADYFETLTQCYCENHLEPLEKMAEKYGKNIRYQVAYNKSFEGERCPLHVGIPENEALGRPAMDYQKLMASAVHLGRKERYSFECAAEFGNSYGQTYDDLMWWVKRSLMAGMNAQVLHGASYSGAYHGKYAVDGHMTGVMWPGYDGFGKIVSNDWNRTLSIEDARGCMDAISRMNVIFRKPAKIDCAIYRQSYQNDGLGSEFCFYPDDGALTNRGYSYETISPALLNLPVCAVTDGFLDKEGVGYKCLIIPEIKHVSLDFINKIQSLLEDDFTVVWQGENPLYPRYYREWTGQREEWRDVLKKVWESPELIHVKDLKEVPVVLERAGIWPEVMLDGEKDMATATRVGEDGKVYYAIYAFNRVLCTPETPNADELACSALYKKGTTKGSYQRPGKKSRQILKVRLRGRGLVSRLNPWDGTVEDESFVYRDGYMCGKIGIEEDEMILFRLDSKADHLLNGESNHKEECLSVIPVHFHELELEEFVPDSDGETSFLRSHFAQKKRLELKEMLPWCKLNTALKKFAGRGTYRGEVNVEKLNSKHRYLLNLGNVQDTFHVRVNGVKTGFPNQVLKELDVSGYLKEGPNQIEVTVVSNLYNKVQNSDGHSKPEFPIPYVEKEYGMWETAEKKCVLYEMGEA